MSSRKCMHYLETKLELVNTLWWESLHTLRQRKLHRTTEMVGMLLDATTTGSREAERVQVRTFAPLCCPCAALPGLDPNGETRERAHRLAAC